MNRNDLARRWLAQATKDQVVLDLWQSDARVADEIDGFHAQQAVEKILKALLVNAAVPFRRTHDIAELCDLLRDQGIIPPVQVEQALELTPFAVEFRYADLPNDEAPLDRAGVRRLVADVRLWAETIASSAE